MNIMAGTRTIGVAAVLGLTLVLAAAGQTTRTWTGAGDGSSWTDAANWSPADNFPQVGDNVAITAGSVALTGDTAALASCIIGSGATLTFANWNTRLIATAVTIGGTVTHAVNADSNGGDGWQPTANVRIECTDLTLSGSGAINVTGKGYQGHPGAPGGGTGYGPGGGTRAVGAGHGGAGGFSPSYAGAGGSAYGDPAAPVDPGSGGGSHDSGRPGGHGGGAVRIVASGAVQLDGAIAANGLPGAVFAYGGGSGGSVYLSCNTLAGAGSISVDGGDGHTNYGGGGAGGRIAVDFNSVAQAALPLQPTAIFSAAPGSYNDLASVTDGYGFVHRAWPIPGPCG